MASFATCRATNLIHALYSRATMETFPSALHNHTAALQTPGAFVLSEQNEEPTDRT